MNTYKNQRKGKASHTGQRGFVVCLTIVGLFALAGSAGIGAKADALAQHGADAVLVLEHAGFAQYNPEALAATVAQRLGSGTYGYALFSATAQGRDLSPRVAARPRP